jgi:hypothetical protein
MAEIPAVATITVKVQPDFSAFREATPDDVISAALNRHAEGLMHANLQRMAADLFANFHVFPK